MKTICNYCKCVHRRIFCQQLQFFLKDRHILWLNRSPVIIMNSYFYILSQAPKYTLTALRHRAGRGEGGGEQEEARSAGRHTACPRAPGPRGHSCKESPCPGGPRRPPRPLPSPLGHARSTGNARRGGARHEGPRSPLESVLPGAVSSSLGSAPAAGCPHGISAQARGLSAHPAGAPRHCLAKGLAKRSAGSGIWPLKGHEQKRKVLLFGLP